MTPEQLLLSQGGVACRADLVRAGWSSRAIDRHVADGKLRRLRNGWVASNIADADIGAAATIGGALTCVSELRRLGAFARDDGRLHISVARNAGRFRSIDGVEPAIHWGNRAVVRGPGAPVEPLDNVIAHLADCQPRDWAIASLDSIARMHPGLVGDRLQQVSSRLATGRLASLLPFVDVRSESGLESLLRIRLAEAGISMTPQVRIQQYRVDGLVGDRLIIEAAGYEFHSARPEFEADHRRASHLQTLGYLVLQFTYRQIVHEWPQVLATVQALLARGEHLWRQTASASS